MNEEIIKGKMILRFSISEHGSCSMPLSDGYAVSAETLCRYVGRDGAFISSQDHGQQFGLAKPFDAAEKISTAIIGKEIKEVIFSEVTGDLTLVVEGGQLEIICNSAGYECYQINGPGNLIIVGRGGNQ